MEIHPLLQIEESENKLISEETIENINADLTALELKIGVMLDEIEAKYPTIVVSVASRLCTQATKYNPKKGGTVQLGFMNFPFKNPSTKIHWWDF